MRSGGGGSHLLQFLRGLMIVLKVNEGIESVVF